MSLYEIWGKGYGRSPLLSRPNGGFRHSRTRDRCIEIESIAELKGIAETQNLPFWCFSSVVTQNQSHQGFGQGKMTISLSYKALWGIMSVLKEDKTMYQTCDMDGLIRVSPHAVFCIFHMFIGLLTAGTKSAPYLSTKALLCQEFSSQESDTCRIWQNMNIFCHTVVGTY